MGVPFFDELPYALLRSGAYSDQTKANKNDIMTVSNKETFQGNDDGGWCYVTAGIHTGEFYIDSIQKDTFGNVYSTYPCW